MLAIREASPLELAGWDELVQRFDNHRIVHTRAWINWLEACGHGRPLYLILELDRQVVGCVPGLVVRLGFVRLFGSPLPGWQTPSMGPVFDRRRVTTQELATSLIVFLERRYGVQHIELMGNDFEAEAMARLGFAGEQVPTFRAQLFPDDPARVLKGFKESARRNVRRGEKLGLVVRFDHDERFVDEHYSQLREVFVRGGNSVPFGKRRVLEFFRHMRAADRLVAVSVWLPSDGPCIASGMFTVAARELLLWSWSHRTKYRWYRPTELMTWRVIQHALGAGCDTFDLMGLGDFKRKFGAAVDLSKTRWVRSRHKWLNVARGVAAKTHRLQQLVRGHVARVMMFGFGPASPIHLDTASGE